MAELVHLNGPMGVGKSTLAAALVAKRRLALNVDIDDLRVRLGGWAKDPDAKPVARSLGFGLAAKHLRDGYDVVLPALLCDFEVVDEVAALTTNAGAAYTEVVVVASLEEIVARLRADRTPARPHPRDSITDDDYLGHVRYALQVLTQRASERPSVRLVDISGLGASAAAEAVASAVEW